MRRLQSLLPPGGQSPNNLLLALLAVPVVRRRQAESWRFKLSDLFPELRTLYLTEADLQDLGLDRMARSRSRPGFTNLRNTPGDLEQPGAFSLGQS